METLCEYCQNSYIPKRSDALYCSQACKQAAYVLRKAGTLTTVRIAKKVDSLNEAPQKDPSLYLEQSNQKHRSVVLKEQSTSQDQMTDNLDNSYLNPSLNINKGEESEDSVTDKTNVTLFNRQMEEYEEHESLFLMELKDLIEERDYCSVMDRLFYSDTPDICWVSERYKCLLECLLLFSERKTIEGDDLKEVCNAFTCLIYSGVFNSLPVTYPYTNEILKLREKLRNMCLNIEANSQPFPFILQRSTKQKFIASRWELSNYFSKMSFNELDFNEY